MPTVPPLRLGAAVRVVLCVALAWVVPVAGKDGGNRAIAGGGGGIRFPVFHATSEEQVVKRRRALQLQRRPAAEGPDAADEERATFARVVPVHGTHEKMGYFYANVHIGTPPQAFGVILDTGSSIMSVPCENCSHCGTHLDPVFNLTASSTAVDTADPFSQSYTEGSSLHGTFVEDLICIGTGCEAHDLERLRFRFGCANRMTNLFRTQLADGIMGMANDSSTFLAHLMAHHRVEHELFTLCLAYEGGSFGVGEYQADRHWSPVMWIPLARNSARAKFYYVVPSGVAVDGEDVGATAADLQVEKGGVFIDSGTTFSYMPEALWKKVKAQFDAYCGAEVGRCNATVAKHDDKAVACYKGFHDHDTMKTFPPISFTFAGQQMCFPPHQYMFYERGYTCVGLIQDRSFVFGSNLMMDFEVIFDMENRQVGFARSPCHEDREIPWCCKNVCHHPDTGEASNGQTRPYHYKDFEHAVVHRVVRKRSHTKPKWLRGHSAQNSAPAPPAAPAPEDPPRDARARRRRRRRRRLAPAPAPEPTWR